VVSSIRFLLILHQIKAGRFFKPFGIHAVFYGHGLLLAWFRHAAIRMASSFHRISSD